MQKYVVIMLVASMIMLAVLLLTKTSLKQGTRDPYPLYDQKTIMDKLEKTGSNKRVVGFLQSINGSDYLLWLYECEGQYYGLSHVRNKFFVPLGGDLKEGDIVHSPYGYNADFIVHFNASEFDC